MTATTAFHSAKEFSMKSAQNGMPCSTKFKILASFMGYVAAIAAPFGVTVSGYSLGRAALAALVLTLISVPVWLKVLRMPCLKSESRPDIEDPGRCAAV